MQVYSELENDFMSGLIVAPSAAVAGVKCRQVANGAVYDNERKVQSIHHEKLDALEGILGELGGAPVLLLYEFDHDRQRILDRIPECRTLGNKDFEDTIDQFNAGHIKVLLGHPASMGHGLNLQGSCHHVIWYGIPWNLEHYDQAIARVYRQGQRHQSVFVYRIVAKNTLDERVITVLGQKDKTQEDLLRALAAHRQENYE